MLRRLIAAAALAGTAAAAQTVTYNGRMGDKALLVIDGQPRTLAVGAAGHGVRLLAVGADEARIDVAGRVETLRIGTPVSMGGGSRSGGGGREIVLPAGSGGHFVAQGAINGKPVQFLVDTGATAVSLSQADADRIGLAWRGGQRIPMHTANGTIPAHLATLTSVRIGDVEVYNVQAVVTPADMGGHVLLGNTYLTRFQMRRDNDTLRLEKKP